MLINLLLVILFIPFNSFAVDINEGDSATCDSGVLNTDTGPVNLRAEYEAENINLKWYNDNTRLTVPNASNSCTYDTAITLPPDPVKPGYKFKGWKIKSALPTGYTELEYVEGGMDYDAYIDLGFPATSTMQTLLTASIEQASMSEQVLLGASDQGNFINGKPYAIDWTTTKLVIANGCHDGNSVHIDVVPTLNTVHQYKINYPNVGTIGVDNTLKTGCTNVASVSSRNLYLFYYNGTSSYNNTIVSVGKMRFYNLKMWDNNVKIHDFIPAKNSNNVVGIYDMVTGAFLTNVGSGNFTAGPEI